MAKELSDFEVGIGETRMALDALEQAFQDPDEDREDAIENFQIAAAALEEAARSQLEEQDKPAKG